LLYPGETVRVLRDIPQAGLTQGAECLVVAIVPAAADQAEAVQVQWYAGSTQTATIPIIEIEQVLSQATEQRTAVIWGLERPPEAFIEGALHALMDQGFVMAEGLNMAQMFYDRSERWWKRLAPTADPSGAMVATSAHLWDGCVVGFSGRQRFHLEFRMKGRGEATILLHEREAAFQEQAHDVEPAMTLARLLFSLYDAAEAQYCAFPVADPWLFDEDWRSLLRPPYYPDFFVLPQRVAPADFPNEFRTARLSGDRIMATVLPVKFAPHDQLPKIGERDGQLNSMRKCKALGEKYYDQMYETRIGASGLYSSAKDAFLDAISAANGLGLKEEARALEDRLAHVKAVFRSQFS
jgi:hypothetical protein